jgi:hypothetical protein
VGLDLEPEAFQGQELLTFTHDGRLIEDALFEVHLPSPCRLRIDNREIVWAGFLRPAEIRAAGAQLSMGALPRTPPPDG